MFEFERVDDYEMQLYIIGKGDKITTKQLQATLSFKRINSMFHISN